MKTLYGNLRLRPTRMGFLVRPTDTASVRRVMRLATCLWGGIYNPIIPAGRAPAAWREENPVLRRTARQLASDYMEFFEPDVVVEAQAGLAEHIGYGALAKRALDEPLLPLDDFFRQEKGRRPYPKVGLPITEVYRHRWAHDEKFVTRQERRWLKFNPGPMSAFAEAAFGIFPDEDLLAASSAYDEVFQPVAVDVDPKTWKAIYLDGAQTPLVLTTEQLEVTGYQSHGLAICVFDPTCTADLIDWWNLRQYRRGLTAVPVQWVAELMPTLLEVIGREHRPIPDNPHGAKFRTDFLFGRSINQSIAADMMREVAATCGREAAIWRPASHPRVPRDLGGASQERLQVTARSARFSANVEDAAIALDTISPEFAERYEFAHYRWANVVEFDRTWGELDLATVYPSNLADRSWPGPRTAGLARPIMTREGWVLGQSYVDIPEQVRFQSGQEAIAGWLGRQGIATTPSGAGRIAQQMLGALGGPDGAGLIADTEIIRLLDKMAAQEVVRERDDQEARRMFDGRSADAGEWLRVLKRKPGSVRELKIEHFTKRGVLKLGLMVSCSHCTHRNWYALDGLGYEVACERCLRSYPFPQGTADAKRLPWRYRVVGPFSVPNFAEGAYAVCLTLRVFKCLISPSNSLTTHATGLELTLPSGKREIDFALWQTEAHLLSQRREPAFIVGEAKSFAEEAIRSGDIATLRAVAERLPGTVLVVSVLKKDLSEKERRLLQGLARWGWMMHDWRMRAPLIVLTATELTAEFSIKQTWEKIGGVYAEAAWAHYSDRLESLAIATQRIHLGLDYNDEMERAWRRRRGRAVE